MGCEAREECGIAAVRLAERQARQPEKSAPFYLFKMLQQQQNRGQLSAGITTFNGQRRNLLRTFKEVGKVEEAFGASDEAFFRRLMEDYSGDRGIGHVRYATFGSNSRSYAQPFERKHGRKWKWFSFAFNGNIANYAELKKELERHQYHLILDSDTEIIMHYLALGNRGDKKIPVEETFAELASSFDGAYNIVFLNAEGELVAARDPFGIKPLSFGEKDGLFAAASESVALTNLGIENLSSLEPGKMIIASNGSIEQKSFAKSKQKAHCMFEWVYFSNIASVIDGKSVYDVRYELGRELAKREGVKKGDDLIVVPVPDSAKPAADGFAFELGVPLKEGLIRNRYVGRTFIEANNRFEKAKDKYSFNKSVLNGKRVLLIEDSIVRGTTTKTIVELVKKEGGAKEVHVRVSCPPIKFPCFYGIDMSTFNEFIAARTCNYLKRPLEPEASEAEDEKIAKEINADSVCYNTIDSLVKAIGLENGKNDLCMACLNGQYPTPCGRELVQKALETFRKSKKANGRTYE